MIGKTALRVLPRKQRGTFITAILHMSYSEVNIYKGLSIEPPYFHKLHHSRYSALSPPHRGSVKNSELGFQNRHGRSGSAAMAKNLRLEFCISSPVSYFFVMRSLKSAKEGKIILMKIYRFCIFSSVIKEY